MSERPGEEAGADSPTPLTEPGSDLPGAPTDDLQQVADEVQAQQSEAQQSEPQAEQAEQADQQPHEQSGAQQAGEQQPEGDGGPEDPLADALGLAEQRLGDLVRERAEFVNYRRRVERDRDLAGAEGRTAVLSALLPVLDDIEGARTHGDLVGPFAAVADKLDATLRRLGLEPFGEAGEPFDPALHEALLQDGATAVDVPTCTQVLQRGYRTGERVLRPARVAVASPG